MAHERILNGPGDPRPSPCAALAGQPADWTEIWRYAYWIVLDRGLATLIAQWVAESGGIDAAPVPARIARLATTRRIAIGMAPGDVVRGAGPDRDASRIAALPRAQREVLVLRHLLGLGDAEVAAVMGCRRPLLPGVPSPRGIFGSDAATTPTA